MITTNTLFILGAGASNAFGFPLGDDLRRMVRDKISPEISYEEKYWNTWNEKLNRLGYSKECVENLFRDLKDSDDTIDEFTRTRKNETETHLCKYLIIDILSSITFEYAYRAFQNGDPWFGYLTKKLNTNTLHEFPSNNVKFITFNYDLSLEICFDKWIKVKYGNPNYNDDKVPEIKHVFGRINEHDGHGHAEGLKLNYSLIAERLKLYHEQIPQNNDIKRITTWAEEIVILGFGFNRTNMDILGMKEWDKKKNIFSTSYNLDKTLQRYIKNHTGLTIAFNPDTNQKCTDLLKLYIEKEDALWSQLNTL